MKKKMGFTLIELLAIIVILAVIAVITVPIILNIVEKSRMSAVTSSAVGYKDAVNKTYVSELSKDNSYKMDNKTYTAEELKSNGVNVEGQEPSGNSWVAVVNNKVVDGCLQFGDYMIIVEDDYVSDPVKGQCGERQVWEQTVEPAILKSSGGTTYYTSEWIKSNPVYYNPVTDSQCTQGDSGCMKWFAYSESNGKVNMLLDHNLVDGSSNQITEQWEDSETPTNYSSPSAILEVLSEQTSIWSSKLARHDLYNSSWDYDNTGHSYTINYSGMKARLISAEEIADATGLSLWSKNSGITYFGSGSDVDWLGQTEDQRLKGQGYSWIFENMQSCTDLGCDNDVDGVWGYWTSTPKTNTSDSVWCVCNGACLSASDTSTSWIGIRPVISVSKVSVF